MLFVVFLLFYDYDVCSLDCVIARLLCWMCIV